jgi:hypothetical protein
MTLSVDAMKSKLRIVCLALILVGTIGRSEACSCAAAAGDEAEQIRREFAGARIVVVARLVSISQKALPESPHYRLEDAEFVVVQVLKGDVAVGQKVRVRSDLGPGLCGRSAQNDPMWLAGPDAGPVATSTEWLIYGHGSEPYELSNCDRSMPLNVRGSEDLQQLRTFLGTRGSDPP